MFVKVCLTFRAQKCVKNSSKRLFLYIVLCLKQLASNLGLSQPLELLNSGVCEQNAILPYKDSVLEATTGVSNHQNNLQNAKEWVDFSSGLS